MSQDSEPQARGPLSPEVEDENKAGGSDRSSVDDSENLRPIVIDGSNVAMRSVLQKQVCCILRWPARNDAADFQTASVKLGL